MFMLHFHTKFYVPVSNGSLVIEINLKYKYRFLAKALFSVKNVVRKYNFRGSVPKQNVPTLP
jgi:hypothetical protein